MTCSKYYFASCDVPKSEMFSSILEKLPGALFFIDDTAKIRYANAQARVLANATLEDLQGNLFWNGASRLVSLSLYQAMLQAKESQELTEVEYVSPMTLTWLHVQISPTTAGLIVYFQERKEPTLRQEIVPHHPPLSLNSLEGLHAAIAILTPDGILLEINEGPLKDEHIQREEVIGRPLAETPWWSFSLAAQEQLHTAITTCVCTGETVDVEVQVSLSEGRHFDLQATITPYWDKDHRLAYLVLTGSDIAARAEERIRMLVDSIPQFVWAARPDGYVIYNNQSGREYTGMTTEQLRGYGWTRCLHPDDQQQALDAWHHAIRTGMPYEVEHRLCNITTGDYRWFLARGKPIRDAQGTILRWVGTCTDIDDRKRAEQRVKASEENLRVLAETVPQLVWTAHPDGPLTYVNQRYLDYAHTTREHLLNNEWRAFLHPDDYQQTLAVRNRAFETGEPYEVECRLRNGQTGKYHWFLVRAMPVRGETGQIISWFGTNTDIDEQKCVEKALRQSQEQVQVLMNSPIIGIFLAEEEEVKDANETFLRMTGYTHDDLRAGRINGVRMTPAEYLVSTQHAHQELILHQSMKPYEKEYICKDGSRLPVLVGAVAIQNQPLRHINFVLDNSARKELERRKDDFINIASHELKTPLAALKLQTALLKRKRAKHSTYDVDASLATIEAQVNRAMGLVEELLDVSKIQEGKLEYRQEIVDLDALAQEIIETLQPIHLSHTIVKHGEVQNTFMGDRDRLEQVFINLISNAIKYSPGAETVDVELSTTPDMAIICVRDHGLGIPKEQHDKIFERFYRAAGSKQMAIPGLGMGLYIVAEIVKRHGGTISVDSEVGYGSTFTVTLPLKRND